MGDEGRAGVKDGKDEDEDDQVDVWCFPERKTVLICFRYCCHPHVPPGLLSSPSVRRDSPLVPEPSLCSGSSRP